MSASKRTAIIIGARPAGLTVARELLHRTDIKPPVLGTRVDAAPSAQVTVPMQREAKASFHSMAIRWMS